MEEMSWATTTVNHACGNKWLDCNILFAKTSNRSCSHISVGCLCLAGEMSVVSTICLSVAISIFLSTGKFQACCYCSQMHAGPSTMHALTALCWSLVYTVWCIHHLSQEGLS